ncbi:MAG: 2-hydroxyacyl-CoA dehydratase [Verrucomicrobia bacterium]|nr:2-hydroxyacyl-CoA dehydratase [Verrucomicrobiota bacterium]
MEVFLTSPWVPAEIIRAHGHRPRSAWPATPNRASAVPEGVCSFAQSLLSLAESHPDAALVFTTACDQMRRAADAALARSRSRIFLFNLPATWQSPAARNLYRAECARLGRFLTTLGGPHPKAEDLLSVMIDQENRRAALRQFIQRHPARLAAEALAGFYSEGIVPTAPPTDAIPVPRGIPVALIGGPLLPSQWSLFDDLESTGGRVVLNATEPGERCLPPPCPIPSPEQPPLPALADHYFDHAVDAFHRPNTRFYDWLGPRLHERQVRGLVLWVHVGCDLWRAEAASLRDAFHLPLLTLDAHVESTGGLRDTNRLAAFIESLQ